MTAANRPAGVCGCFPFRGCLLAARKRKGKIMHTHLAERIARLGSTTTTAWRRVNAKETEGVTEEAVNQLSASGLLEVRIVVTVEMGDKKMPKCRYVGGGPWWTLLEKELDRLVPAAWTARDGKPKENLLKRANVVAIRLTADGHDYNQAAKNGTWRAWVDGRPKKIKAYLRCDGIDKRTATRPDKVKWSKHDTPSRWARVFGYACAKTFIRHVKSGRIRANKLSDKSYQVDVDALPADHK